MELLPRIHQDLFDFIDHDPDEMGGLLEFWYQANGNALSAALAAQSGLNLIINVSSFNSFEQLSKKLFLVADTLVLRDTRKFTAAENAFRAIPIPTSEYKPGYFDDIKDQLQKLRPSPLTLLYRPTMYWTSETKTLNNGYHVAYAGWDYNSIPDEFVRWIAGSGKPYMKTGRVVYAPFIPPLEWEIEFLKNGVNVPGSFGATPCFHQNFDWLKNDQLEALMSIKFPFLDGVDIQTISKIKQDHHEEFMRFGRSLLSAIDGIKSSFPSEGFIREIRNIQRNQIDAAVSDIQSTVNKVKSMNTLRNAAVLIGLLGVNIAGLFGAAQAALVSGLAASGVAMVMNKITQLKEENDLKSKNPYFLWRLGKNGSK